MQVEKYTFNDINKIVRSDQKALADIYYRIITEGKGRKVIKGTVDLNNLHLKELPEWLSDVEVKGDFSCSDNKLTTLKGAPGTVGGSFWCESNKLTTLTGAPGTVGGDFSCSNNKLTTLQSAPKTVGGDFHCNVNPVNFTEEDVRAVSNVTGFVDV